MLDKIILFSFFTLLICGCTIEDTTEFVPITEPLNFNVESSEKYTDPRDSNVYNIATIDSTIWMLENLRYKSDSSEVYNDDHELSLIYGRLYRMKDKESICPPEWRIASDGDWKKIEKEAGLTDYLGLNQLGFRGNRQAKKFKTDTPHWKNPNDGSEEPLLYIIPAGYKSGIDSTFYQIGISAIYYTSTNYGNNSTFLARQFTNYSNKINRSPIENTYYLSVRCIKDLNE